MATKVLVTGADGFIGSHLCEALVLRGYKVRGLVHYNSFNSWGWLDDTPKTVLNEIEVVQGDIRDPSGVKNFMNGCDVVIHLAALIAIPFSYVSPNSYVDTNVVGTLNILQASRDLGLQKVIHTSTSEVYGTARFVPITESHPLQGQSPYSATKIAADQLAYSFFSSFGLPVVTIRPFNTYGPRQSSRAVIPTIITQILSGQKRIKLGSVHTTRDFSFIDDTVSGFISALESINGEGEVFNLGSNFEISISQTVAAIQEIIGTAVEIEGDEKRVRPANSEVDRLWSDNSKAREVLGWEPAFLGREGFNRGLAKTVDWFKSEENLKKYKVGIYNL